MSEGKTKPAERSKLSFDLDEDSPAPITRKDVTKKVEEISKQSGFMAKSPKASQAPANAPEPQPQYPTGRKRASTGRTTPFNTKLRPERFEEICQLQDRFTAEEGRPVGMAEVLERALDALQAKIRG